MAGQLINLTGKAITITAPGLQPITEILDVLGTPGNRFDLSLRSFFLAFSAGTTPSVTINLYTSMYNDGNTAGWVFVDAFPLMDSSNQIKLKSFDAGILRYLRWEAVLSSGATLTNFTFEILGVAW